MGAPGTENADGQLYALLHLHPEASDEDIKKAYKEWAKVYHPDKQRTQEMRDIATENFQRIREAYEILSDERKRQIYDIYGMDGLRSGLELGPKLKSPEEIRQELEKLRAQQQEQKLASHVHHSGSVLVNLSLAEALKYRTWPSFTGMAMSSQVQAHISKIDAVVAGGNIYVRQGVGGGTISVVLRRQISPASSVEILCMAGLRSILSFQTTRQLSSHSTGMLSLSVSLRDGSVTLGNTWSRQLTTSTTGTVQLQLGPDTGVAVGWQWQGKQDAGSGELKVGPTTFGVTGQYNHQFSSKSKGRVMAKIGSFGVEMEVGGERSISEHSAAAMFCVVGLQGISWRFRFTRGGQKFVFPIVLSPVFSPITAFGALVIPSSVYSLLKVFVLKPYYQRRNERKKLEQRRLTITQMAEAHETAKKAQSLLKNVADRKRKKEEDRNGLIIKDAVYGNIKSADMVARQANLGDDSQEEVPPAYLNVRIPLQFLVDDFGHLTLHGGIRKSGLMGFCDPCPGEVKQLKITYSYHGQLYQALVDDNEELHIPSEKHKLAHSP